MQVDSHVPNHPFFTQDGEDREENPGQYISNMRSGAMAGYKYFQIGKLKSITVRTRGEGNGELLVFTDPTGKAVARISITASEDWKLASAECQVEMGIKPLWFKYEGDASIDFESFVLETN